MAETNAPIRGTRCRCRLLPLLLLSTLAPAAHGLTLRQESFEAPAVDNSYVAFYEHGTDSVFAQDYFKRGTNTMFNMDTVLGNINGVYYWGGEDTDFLGPPGACSVTLSSLDVRGFQNLQVAWSLAAARDSTTLANMRYESPDHMTLQVALDAGAWTNLAAFRGLNAVPPSSRLQQDTDLNGFGDGTILTRNFASFTHNVIGLGTGLQVRVLMLMDGNDEEAAFDNVRIFGDPIIPSLAITNPPASPLAVVGTVITFDVAGTANLGVVGTIAWTNSLSGEWGIIPAATNWVIPGLALSPGVNIITVIGSNTVGNSTSASVSINRVMPPELAITNPAADLAVSDLVSAQTLLGTANSFVTGTIAWTNQPAGDSGTIAAATNWSIGSIPLAFGTNTITVTGTNIVNQSTNAVRVIYRVPAPAVTITNPVNGTAVAHDVPSVTLMGDASGEAVGLLRWTNALSGATGSTPAAPSWSAVVPLSLGTNTITVTASNIVGRLATATVSVYQVAAPLLSISTPASGAVADTVSQQDFSGTANGVVGGLLRWTNSLTGGAGSGNAALNWNLNNIPLGFGTNLITITGSNIVNRTASDSRQLYRVPAPAVTITNPVNGTAVAHDVPSVTLMGAASGEAFGLLRWTNALSGATGSTPAAPSWSAVVPLSLGTNTITVTASNIVGRLATATVSVYQVAAPLLSITDPAGPVTLPHATTNRPVSGTANGVVGGLLTWTNSLNGTRGTVPAGLAWSVPAIPLAPGVNPVTITGTNAVGVVANDTVLISREGAILLNEVLVNPVGDDAAANLEFVEALRPAGGTASATGLTLLIVDGNGASAGVVVERLDWDGLQFGANGLLLTGNDYNTAPLGNVWSNLVSPHTGFGDPSGLNAGDLPNTSVTFLLVENMNPFVLAGSDLDTNNDGQLDLHPWSALLDSVGWSDGDAGDHVYSTAALTQNAGTPDAATRLQANRVPHVAAAWFNGDITTAAPDTLGRTYTPGQASPNLPAGAYLTPGRFNYPFPYDADADQLPDWWEQAYYGGTTNASPGADTDLDGYTSLQEFWAGTDPQSGASRFAIDAVLSTGNVVFTEYPGTNVNEVITQRVLQVKSHRLEWASLSNRVYRLRSTTNMVQPAGVLTGGLWATPPLNVHTVLVDHVPARFYRLEVLEPVFPW